MDWKTIGTFAAVIAAILTIAFNAFVQWQKLRRERIVALRKALYSLIEVWEAILNIRTNILGTKVIEVSDKPLSGYSKTKEYYAEVSKDFSHSMKALINEVPLLALDLREHSKSIEFCQFLIVLLSSDPNEVLKFYGHEATAKEMLDLGEQNLNKYISSVEQDIQKVSRICGNNEHRKASLLIANRSSKWNEDLQQFDLIRNFPEKRSVQHP